MSHQDQSRDFAVGAMGLLYLRYHMSAARMAFKHGGLPVECKKHTRFPTQTGSISWSFFGIRS